MVLSYANTIITTTKKNGFVTLRFNNTGGSGVNQGIRLNSNATWQGANAIGDTLSNMYISFINYSMAPSANAIIRRGANVVFQVHGGQEGEFNYTENQIRLEKSGEATSNLSVTFSGPGTVIIKLKKNSTIQTES